MSNENITTISINMTTIKPGNSTDEPWIAFFNNVTKVKIGMAFGLWVTVFIVTLIPFFVVRRLSKKWSRPNSVAYKRFTTWISRINCFAAGVFLSTGFMDIFPEMLESIEEAKTKNGITSEFPLGPCLTLLGFFMILIIEETVTFIKTKFYGNQVIPVENNVNREDHPISNSWPSRLNDYNTFDYDAENKNNDKVTNVGNINQELHDHSMDHTHHEHHDHGLDAEALSRGNLSVTILMIAISIHSIFEGLALGLEKNTAGASRLFLALCLHKYIIAITIGLQISKSTLGIKMACLCSGIFSFATPFGVFLGFWVMYLEKIGNKSFAMVAGVLQGLACGTFFFIVFFEILPEEFSKRHDKLLKVIALILGYVLVCVFMLVIQE